MSDALLDFLRDVITSPWAYPLIFAIVAIDGFLPGMPSEATVIIAGVYAAEGELSLYLAIAVTALGSITGGHVSYFAGRMSRSRLERLLKPGTRRRKSFDWTLRQLAARGGMVIVVAMFIPGARIMATLSMGASGLRWRSFAFFLSIGALSWATLTALLGYAGGKAFEESPLKAIAFGVGLAMSIAAVGEAIRYLRHRRSRQNAKADAEPQEHAHVS